MLFCRSCSRDRAKFGQPEILPVANMGGVLPRPAEGRRRECEQAAGAGARTAGVVRIPWRAFADHEA